MTSDVLIVGGGVNGVAIAFHLARRGARVTVVERDSIAAGPTGRSCGLVRQHYSHPTTARMALESSDPPAHLRTRVTSPGGTTERGIDALVTGGLEHLIQKALEAAHGRSIELGDEFGRDAEPQEGKD